MQKTELVVVENVDLVFVVLKLRIKIGVFIVQYSQNVFLHMTDYYTKFNKKTGWAYSENDGFSWTFL